MQRQLFLEAHRREADDVLAELEVDERQGLDPAQVKERRAEYGPNSLPEGKQETLWQLFIGQFEDLMVWVLIGAAIVSFGLALLEEGEDQWTAFFEPAVIVVILVVNAIVGVLQESSAADAIAKLKASEAEHALALRNGVLAQISASELVPGDIVIVAQGDKVPADCRLIALHSSSISVDQSMLTGESDAVEKTLDPVAMENAVNQDRTNILFSGTLVVRGKGTAVVLTTGGNTEMGQIASSLDEDEDDKPKTPLQRKLDEFGTQLTKVIAVICLVVWLIQFQHFSDPAHGGSWIKGCIYYFKVAVALAVAAIPEGLPAVVTTCLSLGTVKMAKKNAIVRTLPSVETLGSTTVICSDKTGTLTTNKMSVNKVLVCVAAGKSGRGAANLALGEFHVTGDSWSPYGDVLDEANGEALLNPSAENELLANVSRICSLCNESTLGFEWSQQALKDAAERGAAEDDVEGKDTDDEAADAAFTTDHAELGQFVMSGTATEAALKVLSEKLGPTDEELLEENRDDPARRCQVAHDFWNALYEKVTILEFDRLRKSMSVVVHDEDEQYSLLVKGAPESVLERCNWVRGPKGDRVALSAAGRADIERHVVAYAREGLRIIALAEKPGIDPKQDFGNPDRFVGIESDLTFVGLACMLDPPRATVKESIAKCRTAGIRVIVITGDNQVTAESICRRIGVFGEQESTEGKSFTGSQFEAMDEEARRHAALHAKLFSRVEPRHKYELVRLLQGAGHVVAMTGDGVNDSPALSKADIGVAMGSGTSVAKEAADMVLKDDNFETIVSAIAEGRAIFDTCKRVIRYLLSSNIGEVVSIFMITILGMPEAFFPVQLLWVNLVTDGLPATSLSFNPPDKDAMKRPPRGHTESIISGWTFFRYLVIGVYVGVATALGSVWWFTQYPGGPQVSFWQLTHFHSCDPKDTEWAGVDCSVFGDARPSTVALSVLVVIELLNALNALSENQSLLFTLFSNVWVLLADALSLGLHFMILHVPALAGIFHVHPLNADEWTAVVLLSLPVILLDEILKLGSRLGSQPPKAPRLKQD